jgi:hypothetical protein
MIIFALVQIKKYATVRHDRYLAECNLDLEKWKTAREERKLWEDSHLSCFDFDDPDYQQLWNIEIGAEDLYLLQMSKTCYCANISWEDYKFEREKYQKEWEQ